MDKKVIFGKPGGLQITQESLDFMQQSTETLHTLGHALCAQENCRYLIVNGCIQSGTTVSSGTVIFDGEVLPFTGGTLKNRVEIQEVRENADFMDGQPKEVYVTRSVVFTDSTTGIPWSQFRTISAAAGGDLTGNYPDPTIKPLAVTLAKLAAEVTNRLKYREFSAMLRPTITGGYYQDWLLETSEDGVITGRSDTSGSDGWSKYYTFDLDITPSIYAKIVKSSLQVSNCDVWPAIWEIRHYTNYNFPDEINRIQVRGQTIDGGNMSDSDRIYIRFLIEND